MKDFSSINIHIIKRWKDSLDSDNPTNAVIGSDAIIFKSYIEAVGCGFLTHTKPYAFSNKHIFRLSEDGRAYIEFLLL